jgi:geranylgeranyl reductase family protein
MRDVAIVGGGPGGLHVASLLARRGFDVSVYEEHPSSGAPVHCTGVFAADAFDEFDLSRDAVLNSLTTVRFHSPAGRSVTYTSERIEAVAVDRVCFDRQLHAAALTSGATIELGRRVEDVSVERLGVTIEFRDAEPERFRTVVLACGANYRLQRRLGLGLPAVYLQSAQAEVPCSTPGDVEVHFGTSVAPGGFAWVVPVRRPGGWHARVGLMCETDSAVRFDRFLAQVSSRWGLAPDRAPRQKLLPLAPIERTFGDRVLAVGDAAGIVKATTGGGIYYSLLTASLAADTLTAALTADTLSAAALSEYERAWRRHLGSEMRAQRRLRAIAQRLSDDDMEAFFELAQTDGVMPILRRTARFNRHRDAIVALLGHPPARRVLLKGLRHAPIRGRSHATYGV